MEDATPHRSHWQRDVTRAAEAGGAATGIATTLILALYAAQVRPLAIVAALLYPLGFALVRARGEIDGVIPVVLAGAWAQAMATVVLVATDAGQTPLVCLLCLQLTWTANTIRRAVPIAAVTACSIVVAVLAPSPAAVGHRPTLLLAPLILMAVITVAGRVAGTIGRDYEDAAVIDTLTGMLNRATLPMRGAELAHQAALTRRSVAAVVVDIDNFKAVNDRHGHAVGDRVLHDVAYRLRKQLRAFELAYRLGGEEFLVLVPDAGEPQAMELAKRLVEDIRAEPCAGVPTTISIGVAASAPGAMVLNELLEQADEALYRAKRNGRDRVELAAATPGAAALGAAG